MLVKVFVLFLCALLACGANAGNARKVYRSLGSGYYKKKGGSSYYFWNGHSDPKKWKKMKGVAGKLRNLKGGYACSTFKCFFNGKKLKGVAGDLAVISVYDEPTHYARDAFHTYWRGKKMKGVAGELTAEDLYYASDDFRHYFMGKKMKGVSGDLESLGHSYAKDSMQNLFYRGKRIGRSSSNFQQIDDLYASTSVQCYREGKKVKRSECRRAKRDAE